MSKSKLAAALVPTIINDTNLSRAWAQVFLTDIPQMTSKFAGAVLPIHRHGNSVPFVALRCGDFGGLIKFGTPFGKVFHHLDAPLPSFSPLR